MYAYMYRYIHIHVHVYIFDMYMPIYLYISNQVASCCLYCCVSLIHISVKERELLMSVEQNVHVEELILRIQVGFGAMVVTKMKKVSIQCCYMPPL